jgi:two-component system nitrogen regulation sensor histidine kinase NtrY
VLFALAALSSTLTYSAFSKSIFLSDNRVLILIYADIILVLCLSFIVGQRSVKLWSAQRQGIPGARLHVRFVAIFSLLAIVPSTLMAFFAATFLHGGLESWFTERNQQAIQESLHVAETYFKEHQETIIADATALAQLIETHFPTVIEDEEILNTVLTRFSTLKSFSEAIVFDTSLNVVARTPLSYSLEFEVFQHRELEEALRQNVVLLTKSPEYVRALVGIDLINFRAFLLVGRPIDSNVIAHITKVRKAVADYTHAFSTRRSLEFTFAFVFLIVAISLVFAAIAIAMRLSSQIARPIGRLIEAAESIKRGDLTVRVRLKGEQDELAVLSRTFNEMTEQLGEQRHALLSTHALLEERHQFTESVLLSVSSGVISLDAHGRILLMNKTAAHFLQMEESTCKEHLLRDIVPGFFTALEAFFAAAPHVRDVFETDLSLRVSGQERSFFLRATPIHQEKAFSGFVITFDDLTDLIAAQKQAAWSDVARCLAHEIKNPLTPIQLSTERLLKKYLPQIADGQQTFVQLTQTIERQVGNIRRLLDEFSLFARFPNPTFQPCDLQKVCQQAIFLAQTTYSNIRFTYTCKSTFSCLMIQGDDSLLHQVIMNILQNAAQALGRSSHVRQSSIVAVNLAIRGEEIHVRIRDNGPGFPQEHLRQLTDPYVTFTQGGTGLGLSISKKVVQDHGGSMLLRNNKRGAEVKLVFPISKEKGNR